MQTVGINLAPGIWSRNLKHRWEAVRPDLQGLTSGGWQLNPRGHLKKVWALWTSSSTSLPVSVPPHLLFFLPRPPRITWWLVWLIGVVSSRSLELFSQLWRKGRLDFVGVWDEPGMFWHVGTAVTRSTKDAGQLAEQLGGPRRDSPSNNPLREPHKFGTIWLGRKTWFIAMLSISCQKEQVTCRMVFNRGSGLLLGHMFLSQVHQLGMDVSQGLIGLLPGHR